MTMSDQVPITNHTNEPTYVLGKRLQPGETRHFERATLPAYLRDGKKEKEQPENPNDPLLDILFGTVPEVTKALPGLSLKELDILEEAEKSNLKMSRAGVITAISEARLVLAGES